MVHTVGISGPNGNVGKATLPLLVAAAQQGKIQLAILHRKGHVPSQAPAHENIELRAINYEDSVDQLTPKMQGINVFMCVGFFRLTTAKQFTYATFADQSSAQFMRWLRGHPV